MLFLFTGTAASAQASSALSPGSTLHDGDRITSPSGQYSLTMQHDGNLVETTQGRPIWAAMTQQAGAGAYATMQTDGNFVVYNSSGQWVRGTGWPNNKGVPTWTTSYPGSSLKLQNDGNLVIYASSGHPVWSTNVFNDKLMPGEQLRPGWTLYSANYRYRLELQGSDGNLVERDNQTNAALWTTYKTGSANHLEMQSGDGNLVQYNGSQAVWDSKTHSAGAYLRLENSGSAFVYDRAGAHGLWGNVLPVPGAAPESASRLWSTAPSPTSNRFDYGQCTWYAADQFHNFTGRYPNWSGNAWTWASNAAAAGWKVVSAPQVNSIMVFRPGQDGAGGVGHVAWVTNVTGSQITIWEMNFPTPGVKHTRTVSLQSGERFILAP
jgi:surface antigen